MKSAYFTKKNIDLQAEHIIKMLGVRKHRSIKFKSPALLVLDMQDYFLQPDSHAFVPSGPVMIPLILDLITSFREKEFPVIFTKHINTYENAGMMSKWWRDLITPDHPLAGLSNQFEVGDSPVIQKSQYDAFFRTRLNDLLKSHAITDVIVTGVMTHLCCETTARSAFMHGYQVWFAVDGTATYNLELHLSTLRTLGHGFVTPVLVKEMLAVL